MSQIAIKVQDIKQQWQKFISDRTVEQEKIQKNIFDSWKRCKTQKVDPFLKNNIYIITQTEIQEKLSENKALLISSEQIIKKLYKVIKPTGFILILTDAQGYILRVLGNDEIMKFAKDGDLICGSCWNESLTGTNGIGTVIETGLPLHVVGPEHFCILNHRWTSSGAPIRNAVGALVGVLNIVGPYKNANPHTLGIAIAATNAIESLIRLNGIAKISELYRQTREVVLASIDEAIFSVNNFGKINLANKNIYEVIGLSHHQIIGKSLDFIFWGKNRHVFELINNNNKLIDYEVTIFKNNIPCDYTLNINRLSSYIEKNPVKVIILNEMQRTKNLVTHMIGANVRPELTDIVGKNKLFLETVHMAEIVANNPTNVLLTGETGTGKDIFARLIHSKSSQSSGPYLAINCASIPRELIASELFGYEEGAFTGSRKGGNPGKFELANGGTLFLDEIGEMPLELQSLLLRVLEEKKVMRIGGNHQRSFNVRIIAATNKNLRDELAKGNFRADLFYRINTFSICMVPLRNRKDDIPLLIRHFTFQLSEKTNKNIEKIDDRFIQGLVDYNFPGNVRELQNIIDRAVYLAPSTILSPDLLPSEIRLSTFIESRGEEVHGLSALKDEIEKTMINNLLNSNLSKCEIAKKLKISRRTLYRKLCKLNYS